MDWTAAGISSINLDSFLRGLPYSLSIIFIITFHEFGHYFAARYHKVDATLPYYIPFPPIPGFLNFGTMGAVIRTRSAIQNNKAMFDIGVAGPIAGFIASLIVLIIGYSFLPSIDYLLNIHPDYFSPDYGKNYINLEFGNTLLFSFFREIFSQPGQFIPPMSEIYHYPYLCVGWFGLLITAMNLLPVGQLDGGHIIYSMFGQKKQEIISTITMIGLVLLSVTGFIDMYLGLNLNIGWPGWIIWALLLYFVIKIKHPLIANFNPLDKKRQTVGYFAIIIFILSFSPMPFNIW
ncbi:MAG: site-2 protease family protein [Ignavibacteriales bacterium]|nr:site-2 protease family protein [Ignavibacteriales bacterium]